MDNNFAIESFIEYCDSMMIANEAKINIGETIKNVVKRIIEALKKLGEMIRKGVEKAKEKYSEKTKFVDQYGTFEIISNNMGFLNTTTELCVKLTDKLMSIDHPDSLKTYDSPLDTCQDMCDELKEKVEFGKQIEEKLRETHSNRKIISKKEFSYSDLNKFHKILYGNMRKLTTLANSLYKQSDLQDILGNHRRAQIIANTLSAIQKFVWIMTTFENFAHKTLYDGTIDEMMGVKKENR